MDISFALGPYPWIVIPIGLFLGLLGYRLYKIGLFVAGVFVGLAIGGWIGESLADPRIGLILGAVIGIALGISTHFLLKFSLFLAGMAGGIIVMAIVLPYTTVIPGSTEALLWGLGGAVIGGIATLALYKIFILGITSLLGTYLIYLGTISWFPMETMKWAWIPYVVLFAIFVVVQVGQRKGRPDPIDRDRERRRG